MNKIPWFKFYPQDWRGDTKLRCCSIAARGLWIEMCCIMHEASPYGHLTINDHPVTDAQLASLAGISLDQLPDLIGELEDAGVFSRSNKGTVYSRRMTRDEKKARINRKNGQKGGASTHKNIKDNSGLGNLNPNPPPKPQIPEARGQKKDISIKTGKLESGAQQPPLEDLFEEFWNLVPRKVGKGGARKAFKAALKKTNPETLAAGMARYADDERRKGTEDNFIAHPATWLNDERWLDEGTNGKEILDIEGGERITARFNQLLAAGYSPEQTKGLGYPAMSNEQFDVLLKEHPHGPH